LDDFAVLETDEVKERVIIPGSVLAHNREIRRALRRDGKNRLVLQGTGQSHCGTGKEHIPDYPAGPG